MSRHPRAFAAQLRGDANALRAMADALDARAAEQDAIPAPAKTATDIERMAARLGMSPDAYRVYLRSLFRSAPVYADDVHDFRGVGAYGTESGPELVLG